MTMEMVVGRFLAAGYNWLSSPDVLRLHLHAGVDGSACNSAASARPGVALGGPPSISLPVKFRSALEMGEHSWKSFH
jgi:hypothetical protein